MGVDLVRAQPEHVGELGRILYEAFKHIADKHHFPPFFPSVALAREVVGGLVRRTDIYGVAVLGPQAAALLVVSGFGFAAAGIAWF